MSKISFSQLKRIVEMSLKDIEISLLKKFQTGAGFQALIDDLERLYLGVCAHLKHRGEGRGGWWP